MIFQSGTGFKESEAPCPATFQLRTEKAGVLSGYHCPCDIGGGREKMDAPGK